MGYYIIKLVISALLIVLVSEVSKRFSMVGGFIASLPLVSYLAMIWLYADTRDPSRVSDLSTSIFWMVLPSLVFFIALPIFLRKWPFVPSLIVATFVMFACYGLMILALARLGRSLPPAG